MSSHKVLEQFDQDGALAETHYEAVEALEPVVALLLETPLMRFGRSSRRRAG